MRGAVAGPPRPAMLDILNIKESFAQWFTPATPYKDAQKGRYRIRKKPYGPGHFRLYRVRGYTYFYLPEPITITALEENRDGEWYEWMIDDPFNYLAMKEYCASLEGKVLTSGLGLGLAAHELLKNPRVTEIQIVERSPEVILMVGSYLPVSLRKKIVCGDFWKYVEGAGRENTWNSILLDIWVTKGKEQHDAVQKYEVLPARNRLKAMFPDAKLVTFGFAPTCDIDIQVPYLQKKAVEA